MKKIITILVLMGCIMSLASCENKSTQETTIATTVSMSDETAATLETYSDRLTEIDLFENVTIELRKNVTYLGGTDGNSRGALGNLTVVVNNDFLQENVEYNMDICFVDVNDTKVTVTAQVTDSILEANGYYAANFSKEYIVSGYPEMVCNVNYLDVDYSSMENLLIQKVQEEIERRNSDELITVSDIVPVARKFSFYHLCDKEKNEYYRYSNEGITPVNEMYEVFSVSYVLNSTGEEYLTYGHVTFGENAVIIIDKIFMPNVILQDLDVDGVIFLKKDEFSNLGEASTSSLDDYILENISYYDTELFKEEIETVVVYL